MNIEIFSARLAESLSVLPGPGAQERMAPEHRLPHTQWERYYPHARLSGVLILFFPFEATIRTVLIQRPEYPGVHGGQIAFPGGRKEDTDKSLIETALREAHEEVGVQPSTVRVLGKLSELYVPPSNFLITPVVATTEIRPGFVIEKNEVAGILEPSVHELLDEKAIGEKQIRVRDDISIKAPYYDIQGQTVWGATAMIISELNEALKKMQV